MGCMDFIYRNFIIIINNNNNGSINIYIYIYPWDSIFNGFLMGFVMDF